MERTVFGIAKANRGEFLVGDFSAEGVSKIYYNKEMGDCYEFKIIKTFDNYTDCLDLVVKKNKH